MNTTPPAAPSAFRDSRMQANIHAAGAVVWRYHPVHAGIIEIAVIHRPKYDDWSLPKGKLDPGETQIQAAVREVAEETGLHCQLGRYVSHVTYPIPGHRKLKRVVYWSAQVISGEFQPNSEVDKLTWHRLDQVMDELSYPMDRQVVRAFTRLPVETSTLLVVRHGKAGRRDRFRGPDAQRPLEDTGWAQARSLVPNLRAFGANELFSADVLRCQQTLEPLAEELHTTVAEEPLLSAQGYARAPQAARERVRALVDTQSVRVLCSQGEVIGDLIDWWAARDQVTVPPARNRKGSVWVLSVHAGRLVAADHLDRSLVAITSR